MTKPSLGLSSALVKLEDASGWEGVAHDPSATPELRVQLSIAISLKRIADVLDENLGANSWGHDGTLNGILQQINLNGRQ